jgi:hypothetical protein
MISQRNTSKDAMLAINNKIPFITSRCHPSTSPMLQINNTIPVVTSRICIGHRHKLTRDLQRIIGVPGVAAAEDR